jgi:hypothetical protein
MPAQVNKFALTESWTASAKNNSDMEDKVGDMGVRAI